jgi:hypothetical protein
VVLETVRDARRAAESIDRYLGHARGDCRQKT